MSTPNNPAVTAPAIEVTVTVTLAMSLAQVASYAAEYGIPAPAADAVAEDVLSRLPDSVDGSLDSEYWIREFTTVTASIPCLAGEG
jgi:hypothetical protein